MRTPAANPPSSRRKRAEKALAPFRRQLLDILWAVASYFAIERESRLHLEPSEAVNCRRLGCKVTLWSTRCSIADS
jgi:hypothetical protein